MKRKYRYKGCIQWEMQRFVFEIIAPNEKRICECYSEYMAKKICKALNRGNDEK